MTRSLDRPEKEAYSLVQFYGMDGTVLASYTDLEKDLPPYLSTPSMEVEVPDNTGAFQDKEARVTLPLDAFTDRISDGRPHRPAFVRIEQQTRGLSAGEAGTNLVLFRGQVELGIRNYQRRAGRVAITALPRKSRLDISLGLQGCHHDEARIFGPMSGLVQSSHEQTGQISSIVGKIVTITTPRTAITSPTAPGGTNDRFWERGWLEKDGLRIQVHIWNRLDNAALFVLRAKPPADWLLAGTASILFIPGTHGTIEDARDVWDDEEHFLGFGYACPDWNVLMENPLPLD